MYFYSKISMRTCNICQQPKELADLVRNAKSKDGRANTCHECNKSRVEAYREGNKAKHLDLNSLEPINPDWRHNTSLSLLKTYYDDILSRKTEMEQRHERELSELNNLLITTDELRNEHARHYLLFKK